MTKAAVLDFSELTTEDIKACLASIANREKIICGISSFFKQYWASYMKADF